MQKNVIVQVPLFRELFTTLLTQERICMKFFMNSQDVFPEEFLWTEGAMEVSLPGLVDGDVTRQLGFCFEAFPAEITQLPCSVRMLRNDVFGQFQFAFDGFSTVFTIVIEDLFPDKAMKCLLVRDEIVFVAKYPVTDSTFKSCFPLGGVGLETVLGVVISDQDRPECSVAVGTFECLVHFVLVIIYLVIQ